jgi:FdrA protein
VASTALGPVRSNVPLSPQWSVDAVTAGEPGAEGHLLLDLGADEFTAGRPHPMLDPAARLPLLRRWGADPRVSVILLDIVLGHGAHPDPASVLAPAVAEALAGAVRSPAPGAAQPTGDALAPLFVVVALIGTPGDPQDLARQASTLAAAGAQVYLSNAGAARHAADLASTGGAR